MYVYTVPVVINSSHFIIPVPIPMYVINRVALSNKKVVAIYNYPSHCIIILAVGTGNYSITLLFHYTQITFLLPRDLLLLLWSHQDQKLTVTCRLRLIFITGLIVIPYTKLVFSALFAVFREIDINLLMERYRGFSMLRKAKQYNF